MRMGKFFGPRITDHRAVSSESYDKFLEARQRQPYDILSWDVTFRFQIQQQKMVPNHKI